MHTITVKLPASIVAKPIGTRLGFVYDDGGRKAAGYEGHTGDCVTRAIAIATGRSYQEVYAALNEIAKAEHRGKRKAGRSSARTGVYRYTYDRYLRRCGWLWVPTMTIGGGTRVHLRYDELPMGRIIARVSRHQVAVIDWVMHDTGNPDRGGTRAVYGYWYKPAYGYNGFGL